MTIHFHTKHFLESPLSLHQYMILLMYEYNPHARVYDICQTLKLGERTFYRERKILINDGFLIFMHKKYVPSDKLYSKKLGS